MSSLLPPRNLRFLHEQQGVLKPPAPRGVLLKGFGVSMCLVGSVARSRCLPGSQILLPPAVHRGVLRIPLLLTQHDLSTTDVSVWDLDCSFNPANGLVCPLPLTNEDESWLERKGHKNNFREGTEEKGKLEPFPLGAAKSRRRFKSLA